MIFYAFFTHILLVLSKITCTVGHRSRDPCFNKKYMEAGVMTFAANCTCYILHKKVLKISSQALF